MCVGVRERERERKRERKRELESERERKKEREPFEKIERPATEGCARSGRALAGGQQRISPEVDFGVWGLGFQVPGATEEMWFSDARSSSRQERWARVCGRAVRRLDERSRRVTEDERSVRWVMSADGHPPCA